MVVCTRGGRERRSRSLPVRGVYEWARDMWMGNKAIRLNIIFLFLSTALGDRAHALIFGPLMAGFLR